MTPEHVFELDDLVGTLDSSTHDFAEFLRSEKLSLTIAIWPAGATDDQTPHVEEEVYFIASGHARLRVGDEDREVRQGTIAHVPAGVDHRFHSIEEDLHVLVFWAPPRHSMM